MCATIYGATNTGATIMRNLPLRYEQEKPVSIPERVKPKNPIEAPEFVRFYMGEWLVCWCTLCG